MSRGHGHQLLRPPVLLVGAAGVETPVGVPDPERTRLRARVGETLEDSGHASP